jgi:hypothetical protein
VVSLVEPQAGETLRFDPWQSGGGIVPTGLLNRLRAPAYRGSRAGADA